MQDGRRGRTWPWLAGGAVLLAAGAVALSRAGARERTRLPAEAPARMRSALVGGIPMRWEQHGEPESGVPVVLVHGLPTNPRAWRHVVPLLERRGIPCLAWELVGFGSSLRDGLGRDLSIPAQARYLSDWLRQRGIERAVFVGHDYGGGVVQHLAVEEPGLFLGLVLTDSVAFRNWPVAAVRLARRLRSRIDRMPRFLVKALFHAALANLGHSNAAIARRSRSLFWQPYRDGPGRAALAHQLGHFWSDYTEETGERLRPLDCPAIVVWGERDPLGLESAHRLAERLGAELRVIPGAYHFTIEDHPEEIADAVLSVVGNVRADRT